MANLNLSEFTEKLFVTDADHTFIWDSAVSISKRVSRNSWLNSGTLTSDAPVTISQTWGTLNATYTAFKVVANEAAAANTASNMLELWSGNAATLKVRVNKDGSIFFPSGQSIGNSNTAFVCGGGNFYPAGTLAGTSTLGTVGVPFAGIWLGTSNQSAFLTSDSLNTLALRNGAAAQTFRVYGAYPDTGINYARLALSCDTSGNATISTQALGTYTAGVLAFSPGNSERMRITSAGNVGIGTTAPGAKLHVVGDFILTGYTAAGNFGTLACEHSFSPRVNNPGSGPVLSVESSSNWTAGVARFVNTKNNWSILFPSTSTATIQLGGINLNFPALKQTGASIDVRLADDTAFTSIQDLYRRFGAGTPEGVVTAPIGAVYHNTTGGAGTSFYVKESGTGNTGWVGK